MVTLSNLVPDSEKAHLAAATYTGPIPQEKSYKHYRPIYNKVQAVRVYPTISVGVASYICIPTPPCSGIISIPAAGTLEYN